MEGTFQLRPRPAERKGMHTVYCKGWQGPATRESSRRKPPRARFAAATAAAPPLPSPKAATLRERKILARKPSATPAHVKRRPATFIMGKVHFTPTHRAGIIAKRERRQAPSRKENGNAHLRRHRPGVELHSPCHLRSEGRSSQHLFQQGLQKHHQRQGDGGPCSVRGRRRVHLRRRGPRRQRAEKSYEARALLRLQARRRVRHRRAAQRRELRRGRR